MSDTVCLSEGENIHKLILGDNFLSPADMAKIYGFSYTQKQLENLAATLPNFKELLWLRRNNYLLVAGPQHDCNLIQVCSLSDDSFEDTLGCWYTDELFLKNDLVREGSWFVVSKTPLHDSYSRTWSNQLQVIKKDHRVPNVAEACYAMIASAKVNRSYPFARNLVVRTSSVKSDGNNITVSYDKVIKYGDWDTNGILIDSVPEDIRSVCIGVLSAL